MDLRIVRTPARAGAAALAWASLAVAFVRCVPSGNAPPQADAGLTPTPSSTRPTPTSSAHTPTPADLLRTPFEDDFNRAAPPSAAPPATGSVPSSPSVDAGASTVTTATSATPAAGPDGAPIAPPQGDVGPDWMVTQAGIWHIEAGRLCGEHAHNHGIWLRRTLPADARIEFDAISYSPDGDLKAELWGDGHSAATGLSYTNASSYLTIFGGWHNKFHVLARLNEHGDDRKEISIDPTSDDPREKPVNEGQIYRFKVERSDSRTVRWWVDGVEMLSFADPSPLVGAGHDHFGFNDWDVKVCFDNVRIVPLK